MKLKEFPFIELIEFGLTSIGLLYISIGEFIHIVPRGLWPLIKENFAYSCTSCSKYSNAALYVVLYMTFDKEVFR